MKVLFAGGACVAALALAHSASAAIVLSTGQFGGTGVHSDKGLSASTVTGLADSDLVTLSTTGDLLDTSGNGESVFAADDGRMDDLTITFANTHYDGVTFNLNIPNRGTTGFNLSVNGGAFTFVQSGLGNGQNKFRLDATGGDFIHSLAFSFSGSQVQDIRGIRVREAEAGGKGGGGGVPEPASWAMMLVGFGGLGAMMRRRRAALA
jgi:hypothetical protein